MLAHFGHAVEFVLGNVFRHPVAAVIGEVELLGFRMPVEADGLAYAACDHFGAAAVEIHPPDLGMRVAVQHVIAGLPDRNIELVVGPDADELPAMGFVLRQIVVDHRQLRAVEIVLDLVDLGDLREFGDVERAVLERDAVGPMEARRKRLDRSLAVLVGDGIDVADEAAADEHRALVAFGQRTRIGHAGGINFDVETRRQLELGERQLVRGRRNRRRRDRGKLGRGFIARGPPDQRRARRKRRRGGGGAAAGAAAGGVAGCCAAAPNVNTPKTAPASNRLRGADEPIIMTFSLCGSLVLVRCPHRWLSCAQLSIFPRRCAIGIIATAGHGRQRGVNAWWRLRRTRSGSPR